MRTLYTILTVKKVAHFQQSNHIADLLKFEFRHIHLVQIGGGGLGSMAAPGGGEGFRVAKTLNRKRISCFRNHQRTNFRDFSYIKFWGFFFKGRRPSTENWFCVLGITKEQILGTFRTLNCGGFFNNFFHSKKAKTVFK